MRFIFKHDNATATECLALDDALCQMLSQNLIPDTIFLWKPTKFIYVLKNASVNYIDIPYAENLGYPVKRSNTLYGAPTSLLVVGDMWNLITATHSKEVDKFGRNAWVYVLDKLGIKVDLKSNDLVIAGTDRKISGYGTSLDQNYSYQNCFLSEQTPDIDYNTLFKMPPAKFKDKTVDNVADRITSYHKETGLLLDEKWLKDTIIEYFQSVGVSIEEAVDFTQAEKDLAATLIDKHNSIEWINYGRIKSTPDFI